MFHTGDKKLLLIEAQHDCDCYDCDGCTPTLVTKELVTASDVANILRDADMYTLLADLLKNNTTFQRALKDAGWANYQTLKGQKDKVSFTERFYLVEGMTKASSSYIKRIVEVDLENLSDYDANKLVNTDDAALVQRISTTSLKTLCPKAYKAYLAETKKKKAASERAKKAAVTRKQKKLEKELEKARKLLADAEVESKGCSRCDGKEGVNWEDHNIDCPKVQ